MSDSPNNSQDGGHLQFDQSHSIYEQKRQKNDHVRQSLSSSSASSSSSTLSSTEGSLISTGENDTETYTDFSNNNQIMDDVVVANQFNRCVDSIEQKINMKNQMNLANILYEKNIIAKLLSQKSARYFKILFVGGQLNGGIMVDKLIQVFKKACQIESINQISFEETFCNFFSDCYIVFHWKKRLLNLTPDAILFDLTTNLAPKKFNIEQMNVRKRVTNIKSKCKKYFSNIVQQIFNDQPM